MALIRKLRYFNEPQLCDGIGTEAEPLVTNTVQQRKACHVDRPNMRTVQIRDIFSITHVLVLRNCIKLHQRRYLGFTIERLFQETGGVYDSVTHAK